MASRSRFSLTAHAEWTAHHADGRRKAGDPDGDLGSPAAMVAPRGGYASCRLLVRGRGGYRLAFAVDGDLVIDASKAWYHHLPAKRGTHYLPDALVPVVEGQGFTLPDPDNRVPKQTVQEFWLDVYAPPDAEPGAYSGTVTCVADGGSSELALRIEVLPQRLPDEPTVVIDHNSYGCRWLEAMYPETYAAHGDRRFRTTIGLLHDYQRLCREHRCLLHNLGYGHGGNVDPIYAPTIRGRGRDKHLRDWSLFDAHYGPLLDGSAFTTAATGMPEPRMAPKPIWGVYTPINPDWPADYLHFGRKGYAVEFTTCLREFDQHIAERGWTESRIEYFFNHKKRYRWYEWDGDEQKYAKDNARHQQFIELWEQATLPSAVNWVYRADASWQMESQFDELGGHRNFWVCGGWVSWYREQVRAVQARGETVWSYGGCPGVGAPSVRVLENLWKTWARGLDGFCNWLGTNPGADPWFDCTGAGTGILYPGDRFGIAGPIPSVRLKILRNGIQDLDLIAVSTDGKGRERARRALARRIPMGLWIKPPPITRRLPPEDWDSVNLDAEHEPVMPEQGDLAPDWWGPVRATAQRLAAREVAR